MKRREFILAGALLPALAFAQGRDVKVGILLARPLNQSFYAPGIVRRLRELGYRESANMVVEHRSAEVAAFGQITTEIRPAPEFYYAEDYHQQYLGKNPAGYCGLGGTGVSCPVRVVAAS